MGTRQASRRLRAATVAGVIVLAVVAVPRVHALREGSDGVPESVSGEPRGNAALWDNPTAGCPVAGDFSAPAGSGRLVALTFDDGPNPVTTPQILRVLSDKGVRATFFDVGSLAERHRAIEQAAQDAGNVIANHTWSQADLRRSGDRQVAKEVSRGARTIAMNTGRPVCFVRPPYGTTSQRVLRILQGAGFTQAMWNLDPRDWSRPGVAAIVSRATSPPPNRPVTLLLHAGNVNRSPAGDERSQTVEALPQIIDWYQAQGYRFVQVDGSPFH